MCKRTSLLVSLLLVTTIFGQMPHSGNVRMRVFWMYATGSLPRPIDQAADIAAFRSSLSRAQQLYQRIGLSITAETNAQPQVWQPVQGATHPGATLTDFHQMLRWYAQNYTDHQTVPPVFIVQNLLPGTEGTPPPGAAIPKCMAAASGLPCAGAILDRFYGLGWWWQNPWTTTLAHELGHLLLNDALFFDGLEHHPDCGHLMHAGENVSSPRSTIEFSPMSIGYCPAAESLTQVEAMYTRSGLVTDTHHEAWGLSMGIGFMPESEDITGPLSTGYAIDGSGLHWGKPLHSNMVMETRDIVWDPGSGMPRVEEKEEHVQGVTLAAWVRLVPDTTDTEICVDVRFERPLEMLIPAGYRVIPVGKQIAEPFIIGLDDVPLTPNPWGHIVEVGTCGQLPPLTQNKDYELMGNILLVERQVLRGCRVLRWRFRVGPVLPQTTVFCGDDSNGTPLIWGIP